METSRSSALPLADELTLAEAAALAGRSAKTLRRAVSSGQLPRRYTTGPYGPRMVFARADVQRFLGQREAQVQALSHRRAAEPASQAMQTRLLSATPPDGDEATTELREQVAALLAALSAIEGRLADLEGLSRDPSRAEGPTLAVREVEDRLGRLVQRVARLEQGAAGTGATAEQAPTTLGQRLARLEEQQRAEAARQLQNAGVYEGLEARLERLEAATTPERPPERRPPWRRPR